jgi:hypothetical protein
MISPGNLIRVDDELMEVVAIDLPSNSLSVLRGWRGTTATTHLAGVAIQVWEPEESIAGVATRQAALMYARRGAFSTITSPDGVSISYPSDLLYELKNTIQGYDYL